MNFLQYLKENITNTSRIEDPTGNDEISSSAEIFGTASIKKLLPYDAKITNDDRNGLSFVYKSARYEVTYIPQSNRGAGFFAIKNGNRANGIEFKENSIGFKKFKMWLNR